MAENFYFLFQFNWKIECEKEKIGKRLSQHKIILCSLTFFEITIFLKSSRRISFSLPTVLRNNCSNRSRELLSNPVRGLARKKKKHKIQEIIVLLQYLSYAKLYSYCRKLWAKRMQTNRILFIQMWHEKALNMVQVVYSKLNEDQLIFAYGKKQ